jgi:hypothetical protein
MNAILMTTVIRHFRNHLHSAKGHLNPESLRANPELLDLQHAIQIMRKLDHIAINLATTGHGCP